MLNPNSRSVYVDSLRPPENYELHCAIGTTFSLDLRSLLAIPMSMAHYDFSGEEDIAANPIAVLEAVRNTADRLIVFCQAGRISIPKKDTRLFNFLEQSVIETNALSDNGVFHPKTWLLRFTRGSSTQDVLYRFLCLSRNMTFDRSWDTILSLEGRLKTERQVAYARNHPLGDFTRSLPELADGSLSPSQRTHIDQMSDEVRRVDFSPPPGFKNDISFIPIGIPGYQRRNTINPMRQILVVSPFLSEEVFAPLKTTGAKNIIVSRYDSFESMTDEAIERMEAHSDLYYIDDYAEAKDDEYEDIATPSNETNMKGLHAKVYIAEKGWDSHVTTGSANATNAAYAARNVEFLVRMRGPRSKCGITAFLSGGNGQGAFSELLRRYHREDDHTGKEEEVVNLDGLLEDARLRLSRADLSVIISPADADSYDMSIRRSRHHIEVPPTVVATCYPISLHESEAQALSDLNTTGSITFRSLSVVSLTGFVAFRLTAKSPTRTLSISFVRNLPVKGLPEDRNNIVIRSVINNSRNFIQYLLLLLSSDRYHLMTPSDVASQRNAPDNPDGSTCQPVDDIPLFEELLRATSRHPHKIRQIASLIDAINRTDPDKSILPDGFDEVWSAIMTSVDEK